MLWQITAHALLQEPTSNPIAANIYMGRLANPALAGTVDMVQVDPIRPHERTADGCPGGWYRTGYVGSVAPYTRRRTEGGDRVVNPRFDRAPWQTQAAVMHFEHEQERRHAYMADERDKRRERERAAKRRR